MLAFLSLLEPGLLVWELDSLLVRLGPSLSESDSLVRVLGSLLEVLGFLWVTLDLAFSPGFLHLIMSPFGLCADWLLVP